MGHFHTYQVYTKTSSHSVNQAKTGILVPCLSTTSPAWVRGASNRWVQGFNFGYINSDGSFTDYIPLIVKGKTNIHGKEYKGA
jgi:intein/homing endonuclease